MTTLQRFTTRHPCPICGGHDDAPRGEGVRCFGFLSADGQWAHCTRADHAGGLSLNEKSETYGHRLTGDCLCGNRHDPSPPSSNGYHTNGHRPAARKQIVATYDYRDEAGTVLYQVVRFVPKAFQQRRPDGRGDWIWNLQGVRLVPYRLPEIIANPSEAVWVCEGEKDADNLAALGFVATTNAMGSKKWRLEYTEALRGRHVFLLQDADPEGQQHVTKVAHALHGVAASVTVLPPFVIDGIKGSDISDWLTAGGTRDELDQLAADAPVWQPTPEKPTPDPEPPPDAQAIVASLAATEDAAAAILAALKSPETMGALVRVSTADRPTYESLLMTLRTKTKERDVRALERAVNEAKKQHKRSQSNGRSHPEDAALARVRAALDDAPVPDEAVVPTGWRLGPLAVIRERTAKDDSGTATTETEIVARAPVVITGRLTNVNDGTELMRLGWRRDNAWKQETINREKAASAQEIVKVAAYGLPVTSVTAKSLVHYLSDFEAANLFGLPRARISSRLGFQGDSGKDGFLWGPTLIKPDGKERVTIDLDATDPSEWQADWLAFRGKGDGEKQLAEGYVAAGSFEDWRAAVAAIVDHPAVLIAVYASLAAPMLEILGCQNFVVDWSHMTSTGKTTVLRLAASVWGAPDERVAASAMQTWDVTRVWLERAAATLHSIPLILDDTKRARKPEFVAQTIYDIVSGRGRGRGSLSGTQEVSTWRTVLLSTGEQRITDFSQDGGTRPRVLELWGMPFGGTDQRTGMVVQRLTASLFQHFGHAGPIFVGFLLQHRDQWPAWREQFRKTQRAFLDRASDNPFAGRIAEPLAALTMTEVLACAALKLPWGFRDTASGLWEALAGEASEADRAKVALEHVIGWAVGHQDQFYGRSGEDMPSGGWVGRWDGAPWHWIGFLKDRIATVLRDGEFDVESTIRLWRDRGWLLLDDDEKHMHRARIGGASFRLVTIRRDALAEIGMGSDE